MSMGARIPATDESVPPPRASGPPGTVPYRLVTRPSSPGRNLALPHGDDGHVEQRPGGRRAAAGPSQGRRPPLAPGRGAAQRRRLD
jgi:hypothetical protein